MNPTNPPHVSIADAEIFIGLDGKEIQTLASVALLRQYIAGESIFRIGDSARTLLVVGSGAVGLTIPLSIRGRVEDVVLEDKGPGAVIAWSTLVAPHRFTLGAVARTDVTLHCFDGTALRDIFQDHPRLHLVVLENLNQVIGNRVALLEALVARDIKRWMAEKST